MMPDGVHLAVTFWRPVPRDSSERFPVLLELLPYHKDDSFYRRDYPLYSYFVQHGYILAKVDVRGTGGSEGRLPPREYSKAELDDAVEIIGQLARLPGSTGSVGMWGISWGGFSALQVAMRQPPGLRAILALHASDDLFHDDVHYIDGAQHVDPYALEINHENGLPATPDYALDSAYFANRFDAEPWIFTYLRHNRDGEFWRDGSARFHPERLTIPVYLIGGLLDGYRDAVLRLLGSLRGPVKAEIGPWQHDWPDNGTPGPNYEWRARAVQWWDHWLKGRDARLLREPRLLLFMRDAHLPSDTIHVLPGRWIFTDWPIPGASWRVLHPASGGRLVSQPAAPGTDSLRYLPDVGWAAGDWWGDPTGDMRPDDAGSLVYDSTPLSETFELAGFPRIELVISASAPLANWTVRLEDVAPTGEVALVTGAVVNGTQIRSRLAPRQLVPGQVERLALDLHFTTWTYRAGHRIRLAVANAQFPMIWPTPFPMVTTLRTGSEAALQLPLIPAAPGGEPALPAPEPRGHAPDAGTLDSVPPDAQRVVTDVREGLTAYELETADAYRIGDRRVEVAESERWETRRGRPAESSFLGQGRHRFTLPHRELELKTPDGGPLRSKAFSCPIRARASGKWQECAPAGVGGLSGATLALTHRRVSPHCFVLEAQDLVGPRSPLRPLRLCGELDKAQKYESGRRTEVRAAAFHIDYPRSGPEGRRSSLARHRGCCAAGGLFARPRLPSPGRMAVPPGSSLRALRVDRVADRSLTLRSDALLRNGWSTRLAPSVQPG